MSFSIRVMRTGFERPDVFWPSVFVVLFYLSSAHLVPSNKGKRLQEGAEEDVLAEAAPDREDQGQLGDKGQHADEGAGG